MGNNRLSFYIFNYTTNAQVSSYNFNEKIILLFGVPIQSFSTFSPHNVLICNETVKIIHNGIVESILNFSQIYQAGTICDSAIMFFRSWGYGPDNCHFTYGYVVALSTGQILNLTLDLNYTINYSSSAFDFSYTIFRSTIYISSERINNLFVSNSIVLMQSNLTGTIYLYNLNIPSIGIVDAIIPKN